MGNFVFNVFNLVVVDFILQEDLVCDDVLWIFYIKFIFYIGVLVGDIGFGFIVDLYVIYIYF